jgi:hypothetical protein
MFRIFSFTLLTLSALSLSAHAASSEDVVAKLKKSGFLCKDTKDGLGYACTGESPSVYITVPKGVNKFDRSVFYAHGLVHVCHNTGASGENYLRDQAGALKDMKAISVMPLRESAQNAGFPLSSFIKRMDGLFGSKDLPWDLAGHSAAGPFFANELNGNGSGILSRVQNVLLLDAIYGDQTDRWTRILKKQPNLKLSVVSTTTAGKARTLVSNLKGRFPGNVSLKTSTERHCDVPNKFFGDLAKKQAKPVATQSVKNCPTCLLQK